jgi:hypothetical protein
MISGWWVSRSSNAVVIEWPSVFGDAKSPKARLVVTMIEVRS